MKKTTFISLLVCLFVSISAVAQNAPARKMNRKNLTNNNSLVLKSTVATSEEATIVLSEDFSKFTAGSETTPDGTDITDTDEMGTIPDTYTQTEGWTGYGIYQAGGSAHFGIVKYYDEEDDEFFDAPGYIETPVINVSDHSGSFTIKFRAYSSNENDTMFVLITNNDGEAGYSEIPVTNNWNEYSIDVDSEGDNGTTIYFTPLMYTGFIDDIQILQGGGSTSLKKSTIDATVFVKDNLHVILDNNDVIEVYAISGTLITRVNGNTGENQIALPQQGAYIVKVGNTATKVIK